MAECSCVGERLAEIERTQRATAAESARLAAVAGLEEQLQHLKTTCAADERNSLPGAATNDRAEELGGDCVRHRDVCADPRPPPPRALRR